MIYSEPGQEFVIVLSVEESDKMGTYNKTLEMIRKDHLQIWNREEGWVYLTFDLFVIIDERIPVGKKQIESMKETGAHLQAWVAKAPGWVRAPWLEAILHGAVKTGSVDAMKLQEELTAARVSIGSYKGHISGWKRKLQEAKDRIAELENNGDNGPDDSPKAEALRHRLIRRDKKIKDLEEKILTLEKRADARRKSAEHFRNKAESLESRLGSNGPDAKTGSEGSVGSLLKEVHELREFHKDALEQIKILEREREEQRRLIAHSDDNMLQIAQEREALQTKLYAGAPFLTPHPNGEYTLALERQLIILGFPGHLMDQIKRAAAVKEQE